MIETRNMSVVEARKASGNFAVGTPVTTEWKARNHVGMVPDRGFTKQLKILDPELDVVWDWGSEKWEVWKFPEEAGKEPYCVLVVQTTGREYRELGADILLKLQWGRPERFTLQQLVGYFDEMDRQVKRRKQKELENKIESITRENLDWLRGIVKIAVPRSYMIGGLVHA